jgi:hypothetical protein
MGRVTIVQTRRKMNDEGKALKVVRVVSVQGPFGSGDQTRSCLPQSPLKDRMRKTRKVGNRIFRFYNFGISSDVTRR